MSTRYRFSRCKFIIFTKSEVVSYNSNYPTYNYNYEDENYGLPENKEEHFRFIIHTHTENNTPIFKDIKFQKQEEEGMSSKQIKTQDVKKDAMLGGGENILAFSNKQFTTIRGKSTAGIKSAHPKQNHGTIDTIARNGILTAPKSYNSIKLLFDKLQTFKSFDIIVICPYLISDFDGKYPNEYSRPSYIVGRGEITAVLFWYICLYFFGYSSVYDDTNPERNYDL